MLKRVSTPGPQTRGWLAEPGLQLAMLRCTLQSYGVQHRSTGACSDASSKLGYTPRFVDKDRYGSTSKGEWMVFGISMSTRNIDRAGAFCVKSHDISTKCERVRGQTLQKEKLMLIFERHTFEEYV